MFMADVIPFDALDAESAHDALDRRLNKLKIEPGDSDHPKWVKEHHFRQLRLYRLAKRAVPWKKEKGYGPSGKLAFLSELIVENDTWATFMAFSKAWADDRSRLKELELKELEKYLPRPSEIGEDDLAPEDESDARDKPSSHDISDVIEAVKQLEEKISAVARAVENLKPLAESDSLDGNNEEGTPKTTTQPSTHLKGFVGNSIVDRQSITAVFSIGRIVASGLLVLALVLNPQGYYTLLRFLVCAVAVYGVFLSRERKRTGWMCIMGIIAILFNPFIPVWLDRDTRAAVDLATAALFLISLWTLH